MLCATSARGPPLWQAAVRRVVFDLNSFRLDAWRALRPNNTMEQKLIEVRDRGTFIPILATRLSREHYLVRRAGYRDGHVIVQRLDTGKGENDPYDWLGGGRTLQCAHNILQENWHRYETGDVLDVEYELGETRVKKESEQCHG